MSNNFHVNPKEERLNQMREELRERAKREFFLMEFDEIKRAVKYFKIIRKRRIGGTSDYYDLAINAMEKQIPKKPFINDYSLTCCPNCHGIEVLAGCESIQLNYCNQCGQKLDWENEDEKE
jgi:hypothetical protein